jgi:Protein of unknown function (DUF3187)
MRLLPLAAWLCLAAPALGQERGAADAPATRAPDEGETPAAADAELDARPQFGRGPFEVRDPYLLALSRAAPWARSPETLPHLGLQIGLRGLWSNSHALQRDRFVVDGEVRQVVLSLRLGLLDRIELGLQVPYEWRGGGELDGFVEDFHEAFGLPRQERQFRPQDRYLVTGLQSDGTTFLQEHTGYGFGDLTAELRVKLLDGAALLPAAALTLRLRLPTGRGKFDLSDGVDATFNLDTSKRLWGKLDWLLLYFGAAYTYHAESRVDQLAQVRHRGFLYVGVEAELLDVLSIVFHTWVETPRETKLWRDPSSGGFAIPGSIPEVNLTFGNLVSYVAFGIKLEPVDGLTFELGVLENILDPETTADLTFMLNLTWEFGLGAGGDE